MGVPVKKAPRGAVEGWVEEACIVVRENGRERGMRGERKWSWLCVRMWSVDVGLDVEGGEV